MARIRNFALNEALTSALLEEIQYLPEDFLKTWGREFLPGGFTRVEMIRERLTQRVLGDAPLDALLLSMFAAALPDRDLIAALSTEALKELLPSLVPLLGHEPAVLSLLFDPRDAVHLLGVQEGQKPVPPEPPPHVLNMALDNVAMFIRERILDVAGIDLRPPNLPPPDPGLLDKLKDDLDRQLEEDLAQRQKTIDRLNQELEKQKQRHLARLKEESERGERDRKHLRDELHRNRDAVQRLEAEKKSLEQKLRQTETGVEEAVHRGVEERTSAILRKWLEAPTRVEAALGEAATRAPDVLARARQALEAQARQDRHTGNRVQLEGRLQELREWRQRLADALSNALVAVPDLKAALVDLDAEIQRVEKALGSARQAPEIVTRIATAIAAAADWDALHAQGSLLEKLAEAGVVKPAEMRQLYETFHQRYSLLTDTIRTRPPEPDTGWSLRDTLFRNKTALLVIDGHNALFGLPEIFSPDYEEGFPRRKARHSLIDMATRLVRERPNIQVKLCFDGADAATQKLLPNLEVIYSGGTGTNRADQVIVSQLQFKDLKSLDQKVYVVSDDREVRKGILQTGAKFVRVDLFGLFLRDFGCIRPAASS